MNFLQRLQSRKIVQWAVAYLAGAWLLLQVLELLADTFDWGTAGLRVVTVLLGVGLLAVITVAWYHGERGRQRASGIEILMLAGILVLAGAAVALVGAREPDREPATPAASESALDPASVVVLPFADMSPGRDQEYFADGLTEEILNALVRVPGLRVPARTTSFAFKALNVPVGEIAAQLGVAHVLEGSVRKSGEQLRITAQLVDARTDRHLWSETYDRQLADVFAIQEEIARAVVAELAPRLAPAIAAEAAEPGSLVASGPTDTRVYELYLRGLHLWNRRSADDLQDAVGYFEEAIARDPKFARGYAGLALSRVLVPEYAEIPVEPWAAQAREAASKALELDPTLAEARTALAYALVLKGSLAEGVREFRRALELNPSYPTAHQWLGATLNALGQADEALAELERARELDPLSFIITANLADQLYYRRRFDEALALYESALELNPEGTFYQTQHAVGLLSAGREEDALREVEPFLSELREGRVLESALVAYVLARAGRLEQARGLAEGLEERARREFVSPTARAYAWTALGEHERALTLLEEAVRTNDPPFMYYAANDPVFDPLRDDPRYVALLRRYQGG